MSEFQLKRKFQNAKFQDASLGINFDITCCFEIGLLY